MGWSSGNRCGKSLVCRALLRKRPLAFDRLALILRPPLYAGCPTKLSLRDTPALGFRVLARANAENLSTTRNGLCRVAAMFAYSTAQQTIGRPLLAIADAVGGEWSPALGARAW
jgi:hypothetical protein